MGKGVRLVGLPFQEEFAMLSLQRRWPCWGHSGLTSLAAPLALADLEQVRFGVPPWPGVTVKSEVAAQLLEAMGYETRQNDLAVSVILNGVARAIWTPTWAAGIRYRPTWSSRWWPTAR